MKFCWHSFGSERRHFVFVYPVPWFATVGRLGAVRKWCLRNARIELGERVIEPIAMVGSRVAVAGTGR
jgi:hypothetical protein